MSDSMGSDEDHVDRRKVLVLGLDGATFKLLEPMAKEGRIPNLARLMEEGARGVLESTLPPVTIPAWISMMTGKNPGRLGLYDLLKRVGYGVEPNESCFKESNPVWRTLNQHGLKTGIMNLPGTYPPDEVDGFMVTGMMTPSTSSPYAHPTELKSELNSVYEYEIDVPPWSITDSDQLVKDIYRVTQKRADAAEYLIGEFPCDFYMIVFTASDRMHHYMWHKEDLVKEYWEELDRVLARLLDLFGEETTVFVVSDHGFGTLERTFFVNEWLRTKGLLRVRRQMTKRVLVRIDRAVEGLYRFLGERKLISVIGNFLYKFLGFGRLQKVIYGYLSNVHLESRVNWRRTKAFSCVHTPHFGQIYLNMEGKMRDGCVSEDERGELQESIIRELKNLPRSRTGDSPEIEVHLGEDLYNGPHLDEAPDIVFIMDGGRCEIDAKVGEGRLFAKGAPLSGWTGTHTRDGVFIAHGPLIEKGYHVEKASIVDVAPTILQMFGIAPGDDMDGKVLNEIFREGVVFPKREKIGLLDEKDELEGLDDEEKALIEARLRKLGYIS
jgi:predicted AlkP superfamily phosphohydrolase/phosphomutase